MREIKVDALVEFNDSCALVLNRMPEFKVYRRNASLAWSYDSGFYNCYRYERPSKAFQAFGGREFELPLSAGGSLKCNGQWWDGGIENLQKITKIKTSSCTISTIDRLKECYVFSAAYISEEKLSELVSSYNGCVYPYWDYKKVIKFDDMRRKLWNEVQYYKKAKSHIVRNIKKMNRELLT